MFERQQAGNYIADLRRIISLHILTQRLDARTITYNNTKSKNEKMWKNSFKICQHEFQATFDAINLFITYIELCKYVFYLAKFTNSYVILLI